ncbi:MAG: biotin synthase BioB [Magnetococcus sp. WYHC-3]
MNRSVGTLTPWMKAEFYQELAENALAGQPLATETALRLLTDPAVELLPLLQAAWVVRRHFFGRGVRIHILNNAQNGLCSEDCNYCAQSRDSQAPIVKYPLKSDEELMDGARRAWESGAYRYCMVLSGRGPGAERVAHMADVVRRIKAAWPVEVCLSAGFIDKDMAQTLKEAGLDRYNHNLNTAEARYGAICRTHDFAQRVATLQAARDAGLEVCSGLIIGLGESHSDVVTVAWRLRELQARSIPVNFYVHVPGAQLNPVGGLTPEYCLRVLCLFRLINPSAEIRAAGGREVHLGPLESLSLYPANSLFSEGYLNVGGQSADRTRAMVEAAGFVVEQVEILE